MTVSDCSDVTDRLLTVFSLGAGTGHTASSPRGINCGPDCREVYPGETVVALSCVPDMDSEFTGFGGDTDCGDGQVTMDSAKSCLVWFEACSLPSVVSLPDQSVDDSQSFEACNVLEALSGFTIEATGDVSFRAGNQMALGNGFEVAIGARFEARIGPP